MDELDLLKGLRNKDETCFIELVNLYNKKVISLCYSYTDNYYDAEDLSQEVFISLYKSINNFRGDSSLSTYLYKITLSKCIDFKRKKSIKNFLSGLLSFQHSALEDIDEKNYIRQCISALPEEMKKAVILYYYVGLSQKEIAQVLRVSEKAVEGKIYRAKQKLRIEFEKEGDLLCRRNEII